MKLWRQHKDEELDAEIQQHLDEAIRDRIERGESPDDARAHALREFGNVGLVKEVTREMWGWTVFEQWMQDLRFGLRMLRKNPGFSLVAILTLALGIGANAAFFTLFGLAFRALPIREPESVVRLEYHAKGKADGYSFPEYVFFRDHAQVFSGMIASSWFQPLALAGDAEAQSIRSQFVSENFFSALGAPLAHGRAFVPEANQPEAAVVLSHSFWQRRFGGNANVIGQTLRLNGKPLVVIAVTAPEFVGLGLHELRVPDVWLPLHLRAGLFPRDSDWFGDSRIGWLNLAGRLKPGCTVAQANAEMTLLLPQLARAFPALDPQARMLVRPVSLLGAPNRMAWQVGGVVLLATVMVLLIACANLANLLLARAAVRRKEIGLRLCLGASRLRVMRQLLTESLLLAVLGGAVGLLLAWWSLRAFLAAGLLAEVPLAPDVETIRLFLNPDARVVVFTTLLTLLATLVFGLFPALQSTRTDLASTLKDEGALMSQQSTRSWFRNGLVIAQVSLSLVLLIVTGLLLRGLVRAGTIEPGFEMRHVLIVEPRLELSGYDPQRASQERNALLARLASLPGVVSVSQALDLPLGGVPWTKLTLSQAGQSARSFPVAYNLVTSNFFETAGIPLVRGRSFSEGEVRAQAPVAIVSEMTARTLWPNQEPLGQVLQTELDTAFVQVIGVARDAQTVRWGEVAPRYLYLPFKSQEPAALLLRTLRPASEIQPLAQTATQTADATLLYHVRTLEDEIAQSGQVKSARTASRLALGLGALALLLAVMGLYGVMSYAVSQRTRELGIRLALGAPMHAVVQMVLGQGLRLVLVGVLLGLGLALALTRVLKSLLFGLSVIDPLTFTGIALLQIAVAVLAIYLPARRATKVDPLIALRHD